MTKHTSRSKEKIGCLYHAIDSNGETLGIWLRKHRDTVSTKAFIKRLIQEYEQPRSIVTDKYTPSLKAIKELKEKGVLDPQVNHWKSKYLNDILEKDHRQVKGKHYPIVIVFNLPISCSND